MRLCRHRLLAFVILFLGLMLGVPPLTGAIPGKLIISGQLLDQYGNPVRYMKSTGAGPAEISAGLAARIKLYDSAAAATPFAVIPTTATAYNAYFNIAFTPPESALTRDALWYSLSLDVGRNGLGADDDFPDRFEIGAAPYALSARPATFHVINGCNSNITVTLGSSGRMNVSPFATPAGGLEFNQMTTFFVDVLPGASLSFGVYDETGKLIVSSKTISITAQVHNSLLQVKHETIRLQPSKLYFVGLTYSLGGTARILTPFSPTPPTPLVGSVALPSGATQVPSSFDPSAIVPNAQSLALPVTFRLDPAAAQAKAGWSAAKPGEPQHRWIPLSAPLGELQSIVRD